MARGDAEDSGSLTYGELDARAIAMAERLWALGAVRGHAVTLCANPSPDAVAALFALWRAGCVAVPLHERLTRSEVAYARRIVNATLHIDNSTLHILATAGGSGGSGGPGDSSGPGSSRGTASPAPVSGLIAYILTSGSSGAPRALGFTRDPFAASASAVASRLGLTADDRWGLCLSLGHIGGLSLVVRAVMTGASVRLWPKFDAASVARAVLGGQVTHLAVVPVMLRRILSHLVGERIPPSLRCVLVGGAAASRPLLDEAWSAGLPVAPTWGMTETASQIATALPDLARRRPGTAGRPLRGVEVRVAPRGRAPHDTAEGSPAHTAPGALQVRGPTLASAVIRGPGEPPAPLPTDPDGWFTTSDVGRVDREGLVWIGGRADEIIVSGGLNVSPAEVERVIGTLPGVRDAVAFGLPDEEWGEVVAAVVEADERTVGAESVDRHCRARLAAGRRPTRILVVDELPRTWTGKTMRVRVRERYGPLLEARRTA